MVERSIKPNGLAVRSWGDVIAVATLLAMLLAVVMWGLKLEAELKVTELETNSLKTEVAVIKSKVDQGQLNVAATRLNAHDRRLSRLEDEFHRHQNDQ